MQYIGDGMFTWCGPKKVAVGGLRRVLVVFVFFWSVFDSGWTFWFFAIFFIWVRHSMRVSRFTVVGIITITGAWPRVVLYSVDPKFEKIFPTEKKNIFQIYYHKDNSNKISWPNINGIIIIASWEFFRRAPTLLSRWVADGRFAQRRAKSRAVWYV